MDEQRKTNSGMTEEAKNEKKFGTQSLCSEVLPLMKEYFIGEFMIAGDIILCKFPNGQKFEIKFKAV